MEFQIPRATLPPDKPVTDSSSAGSTTELEENGWDKHKLVTSPYNAAKQNIYQDMSQPLSSYFISSGHNSYLTGNQLFSASGTTTIVKCLRAGCRIVELDVYNGPVCKHGGTLTSAIDFRECVEAVEANAFTVSPYPVIITIENHANPENQAEMARILRSVLRDKLFVPDPCDPRVVYASPEELRGKVVCRTSLKPDTHEEFRKLIYICNSKFTSFADTAKLGQVTSASFEEGMLPTPAELGRSKKHRGDGRALRASLPGHPVKEPAPACARRVEPILGHPRRAATDTEAGAEAQEGPLAADTTVHLLVHQTVHHAPQQPKQRSHQTAPHEAPELREAFRASKRYYRSQRELAAQGPGPDHVPDDALHPGQPPVEGSLGELYAYTARHLVRVYPAYWRVLSGNYNPMKAWVQGVSVAALNWQVWDKPMRINQGKFMDNGGCGYVLKPPWMLKPGSGLPARSPRRLTVRVLSAFKDQGWSIGPFKDDLFVRIRVVGMPADCAKRWTGTAVNSGRLRVDKDFAFDVRFPEMAVLSIELMDEDAFGGSARHIDAETLAYFTLPLATLAEGEFKLQMRSPRDGSPLPTDGCWVKVALWWGHPTGRAGG